MSCRLILAAIFISAAGQLAFAQAPSSSGNAEVPLREAPSRAHNMYRGSKIIDAQVVDGKSNKIGNIKDLILDSDRGEIAYVVIGVSHAMSIDGKYYAVPWRTLEAGDNGNQYILHADRQTLQKAPGFDRRKWPDIDDPAWGAEVNRYWEKRTGQGTQQRISPNSGANSVTGGVR